MYLCVQDFHHHNATSLNTKYGGNRFKDYKAIMESLPESVDWRTAGAVNSVKDQVCLEGWWVRYNNTIDYILIYIYNPFLCMQLRCGCSYAFSAIGALEGAMALAHGNLIKLSEQNIVDCSGIYSIAPRIILYIEYYVANIQLPVLANISSQYQPL